MRFSYMKILEKGSFLAYTNNVLGSLGAGMLILGETFIEQCSLRVKGLTKPQ